VGEVWAGDHWKLQEEAEEQTVKREEYMMGEFE
jgi:hypothetical protein